jgi:uncharacterized protein (TIGR02145 family)
MDRNLGATKASLGSGLGTGLFYQWGRKDPFPATGNSGDGLFTIASSSTGDNGTVKYAIKNPGVFLIGSSDWLVARDDELWGHSGLKTIYDPCPSGWRVPVNSSSGSSNNTSPWYGFADSSNKPANIVAAWNTNSPGYSWGDNAKYPAAGYRGHGSGALSLTGTYGYYWSASPYSSSSNYASTLRFNSGYVNVSNSSGRAYGFSVRCSQE